MILVYSILYWVLQTYAIFLSINILLSWVPNLYEYKFFRFCKKVSDWYLGPFHGGLVLGNIDLTPIIGLGIYQIAISCLVFIANGI